MMKIEIGAHQSLAAAVGGSGATERVISAQAIVELGTQFADSAESGAEFVPEDIGGEMLMTPECPELSSQYSDSMRTGIYGEERLFARGWARSFLSGRGQSARGLAHSMPWRTLATACTCVHTGRKGE